MTQETSIEETSIEERRGKRIIECSIKDDDGRNVEEAEGG